MERSFGVSLRVGLCLSAVALVCVLQSPFVFGQSGAVEVAPPKLEISRPVRPWEFMDAVGQRAGIFGNESGTVEAWVYPLKLLSDFQLTFRSGGREMPAAVSARTLVMRPEATTVEYAGDTFSVRETWFVPVNEQGALIRLEVDAYQPLDIEANFRRDFNLMWPAALGATYESWSNDLKAFTFGEESKKYFAIIGAADARETGEEFSTNYDASRVSGFRLPQVAKGKTMLWIALAASFKSREEVEATYRRLLGSGQRLMDEAASYYAKYLEQTVSLKLPDAQLQSAYDWSRVSLIQGLVTNPDLGTGLIAGYRSSGEGGTRPGFAWFFGRDSMWTALATTSYGDLATTRTALEFLSKVQRADGKVPHEISQSAALVDWFNKYPYPWASADATPLYVIVLDDYVRASGDVEFARAKWDNAARAYKFLQSTMTDAGLARNLNIGHGWVEGGPLLPVETELYQSGLGAEAERAYAHLANVTGHAEQASAASAKYDSTRRVINEQFWSPEKHVYGFALDTNGRRVDLASVLSTVPMWFGVLDADKTDAMITRLADADHAADWGMRIISSNEPIYDPSGYHFGTVWPLFTGWAAVGEYRYHRALPAYANLRANALLTLNGAAGRTTEVLSGSYYEQLSTSSPHQIWSSAMVISPMLRGMMGLSVDAASSTVTLAPHVPAEWPWFELRNVKVGGATLAFKYEKTDSAIQLRVTREGPGESTIEFSPVVSPAAQIGAAQMDGRAMQFKAEQHTTDQHVATKFRVSSGTTTIRIPLRNDFGVSFPMMLPPLGSTSQTLKVVSEAWSKNRDSLTLIVAGLAGREYEMSLHGTAAIKSVDGAQVAGNPARTLRFRVPAGPGYQHHTITIRFAASARTTAAAARESIAATTPAGSN